MNVVNYGFHGLTSPLQPIVQYNRNPKLNYKQARPLCNCDDDSDDMAPECAFVCNQSITSIKSHNTSKRRSHVKQSHTKKMKYYAT